MAKAFRDHFGQDIGVKLQCKMPYEFSDGGIIQWELMIL
jgi:hypothetical protein